MCSDAKDIKFHFINRYKKLQDPKEWVSIEEVSGLLTISKALDRESMAPRNDLYNITVMAIDQGNKVLI